jgi:hypothetical protein
MGWTATTVPAEPYGKDGEIISYPMADNVAISKGDIVRVVAAGYADSTTEPAEADMFVGVAMESVDNTLTGHAAGLKSVRVWTTGIFEFDATGMAQTDVGTLMYIDHEAGDQKTVKSAGVAPSLEIGTCVGIISATRIQVKIRPQTAVAAAHA